MPEKDKKKIFYNSIMIISVQVGSSYQVPAALRICTTSHTILTDAYSLGIVFLCFGVEESYPAFLCPSCTQIAAQYSRKILLSLCWEVLKLLQVLVDVGCYCSETKVEYSARRVKKLC